MQEMIYVCSIDCDTTTKQSILNAINAYSESIGEATVDMDDLQWAIETGRCVVNADHVDIFNTEIDFLIP